MTVRQYGMPLESRGQWEQTLCGIEHAFGHTWENRHAMHLTTGRSISWPTERAFSVRNSRRLSFGDCQGKRRAER